MRVISFNNGLIIIRLSEHVWLLVIEEMGGLIMIRFSELVSEAISSWRSAENVSIHNDDVDWDAR